MFTKLLLLIGLAPAFASAEVDHTCSHTYGVASRISAGIGLTFGSLGVSGVVVPLTIQNLLGRAQVRKILELEAAEVAEATRFFRKFERPLIAGSGMAFIIGDIILARSSFDDAFAKALIETENGQVGNGVRGLSVLINHSIFSSRENPSELIPVKVKISRHLREELAGALGNQPMSARDTFETLKVLIAERQVCAQELPMAQFLEQIVWAHTRNLTPRKY